MKYSPLMIVLLLAACSPAVDSPKVFDNDSVAFSYPGNWNIDDQGSIILVEEMLFFGLIPGSTTIELSLNDDSSPAVVYDQLRDVQAKIGAEKVSGNLEFDWISGDFRSTYMIQKNEQHLRILVIGNEEKLKKVEPGIRLVLDTLNLS